MNKAHIPLAMSIRGMLNHNFVDANFPKYCTGEMDQKKPHFSILVFSYITYFTNVRVCTKFEDSGSNSRWEICGDFLWEGKKNRQIKRMTSMRMLILFYIIQLVILSDLIILGPTYPMSVANLKNPRCSSSWVIFDTDILMHYTGVRDEKKKVKTRQKKF